MPGLRVGQTWTVPLYSPFRPATSPMEILQASVEREDKITWNGKAVPCRVIVFRNDSGSGLIGNETRGRVWVSNDGLVLCQEITVFRSQVRFFRMADGPVELLTQTLGQDWMEPMRAWQGRRLLEELNQAEP